MVAALVLACCGGGGESAEHKQYVSAAESGLKSGKDKLDSVHAHCLALSLVDEVGTTKLKAAGVTPAKLRDPNSDLSALKGKLSTAEVDRFARAVQQCRIGDALAASAAGDLGVKQVSASEKACFAKRIDAPSATSLMGAILLSGDNDNPTPSQARALIDMMFDCFDFGKVIAESSGVGTSPAESSCFSREVRASAEVKQALADALAAGQDPEKSPAADRALSHVAVKCLDFGKLIGKELKLDLSTAESTCINRVLEADPAFEDLVASAALGGSPSPQLEQGLGPKIIPCLTPEHLAQLQSGGSA
jgi:hypothetical protein